MLMNVIEITRRQPAGFLAWTDLPPTESYGLAGGVVQRPVLQNWNTAVALENRLQRLLETADIVAPGKFPTTW